MHRCLVRIIVSDECNRPVATVTHLQHSRDEFEAVAVIAATVATEIAVERNMSHSWFVTGATCEVLPDGRRQPTGWAWFCDDAR